MAKEYPLIRIPTQPARVRLVDLFTFVAFVTGIAGGGLIAGKYFGVIGRIIGAVIGGFLGIVLGMLPSYFIQERLFREMQKSSNEELKTKLEHPLWSFYQTLALLNLQIRGENVQPYLPRVLTLLESDDDTTRLFARDALRLVFTPLAKQLDDFGYEPRASGEDCRNKVAKLREKASAEGRRELRQLSRIPFRF